MLSWLFNQFVAMGRRIMHPGRLFHSGHRTSGQLALLPDVAPLSQKRDLAQAFGTEQTTTADENQQFTKRRCLVSMAGISTDSALLPTSKHLGDTDSNSAGDKLTDENTTPIAKDRDILDSSSSSLSPKLPESSLLSPYRAQSFVNATTPPSCKESLSSKSRRTSLSSNASRSSDLSPTSSRSEPPSSPLAVLSSLQSGAIHARPIPISYNLNLLPKLNKRPREHEYLPEPPAKRQDVSLKKSCPRASIFAEFREEYNELNRPRRPGKKGRRLNEPKLRYFGASNPSKATHPPDDSQLVAYASSEEHYRLKESLSAAKTQVNFLQRALGAQVFNIQGASPTKSSSLGGIIEDTGSDEMSQYHVLSPDEAAGLQTTDCGELSSSSRVFAPHEDSNYQDPGIGNLSQGDYSHDCIDPALLVPELNSNAFIDSTLLSPGLKPSAPPVGSSPPPYMDAQALQNWEVQNEILAGTMLQIFSQRSNLVKPSQPEDIHPFAAGTEKMTTSKVISCNHHDDREHNEHSKHSEHQENEEHHEHQEYYKQADYYPVKFLPMLDSAQNALPSESTYNSISQYPELPEPEHLGEHQDLESINLEYFLGAPKQPSRVSKQGSKLSPNYHQYTTDTSNEGTFRNSYASFTHGEVRLNWGEDFDGIMARRFRITRAHDLPPDFQYSRRISRPSLLRYCSTIVEGSAPGPVGVRRVMKREIPDGPAGIPTRYTKSKMEHKTLKRELDRKARLQRRLEYELLWVDPTY